MPHNLNTKQQALVAREIKSWREENLIGEELEAALLKRYPLQEAKSSVSGALSLVGCILIGLGTLLFIGANWQVISIGGKLGIVAAAIVLANFFGWRLRFEPGVHPKLGTSFLLLGGIFFGGGIWLVSQIFNMDINLSDGMLIWSLGTIATALVTQLVPLGCLSTILLSGWALAHHNHFSFFSTPTEFTGTPEFLTATTVGLLQAYLRSRAILWITLATGCMWMLISLVPVQALLLWGLACFGGYLYCRDKHELLTSPLLYSGTISTLSALLTATFFNAEKFRPEQYGPLGTFMFIAMVVLLIVAWRVAKYRWEAAACIFLGIAMCLTTGYTEGAAKLISNIILLAAIGGLMYTGLNRVQSKGAVNVALVFFVFDIIARYSDYFYTLMNRSLFFIMGGVVLVTAGWLAERGRQKLLHDFDLNEASTK